MRTNKAAALAKFLERKLQEPDGLASINPDLVEIAVQNAKRTVLPSCNFLLYTIPFLLLFFIVVIFFSLISSFNLVPTSSTDVVIF